VALEQGNVTFRWRDSAHANNDEFSSDLHADSLMAEQVHLAHLKP
jgi:hypothetical protein